MPQQQTHIRTVRQWCQSLGILSAVSISRQEAEMKLAAYVPMLLARFPDAAFTTESLEHVARRAVKGFPTYGELAEWLGEHWKETRPPFPAIAPPPPPPPRPEPTPEEIEHVRQLCAQVVGELRASAIAKDTVGRPLPTGPVPPTPRYLSPDVLDRINPLPNGRKRAAPPEPTP